MSPKSFPLRQRSRTPKSALIFVFRIVGRPRGSHADEIQGSERIGRGLRLFAPAPRARQCDGGGQFFDVISSSARTPVTIKGPQLVVASLRVWVTVWHRGISRRRDFWFQRPAFGRGQILRFLFM